MNSDSRDNDRQTEAAPTTPTLVFTPDPNDTSATSSPSECSENASGWGTTSTSSRNLHSNGLDPSKDTLHTTLHHGYGRTTIIPGTKDHLDFDDMLWKSQIQRGAPVNKNNTINATSRSLTNDHAASTSTSSVESSSKTQRRHSSSCESHVPYRQSSLKWKQRNGSATFELKLSQEEFTMHQHTAVFAD